MRRAIRHIGSAMLTVTWLSLVAILIVYALGKATFQDAQGWVVSAPYIESPKLRYVWQGEITSSCPIVIDRKIITSENVVITLQSSPLLPPAELGPTVLEIEVDTPADLPPGRSVYQATERPRCNWLQRLWPPKIPYPPVYFTVTR